MYVVTKRNSNIASLFQKHETKKASAAASNHSPESGWTFGQRANSWENWGNCKPYATATATATATTIFTANGSAILLAKTKLRNKMGDSLLDDCLVIFIERDIFFEVEEGDIIKTFMSLRKHRIKLSENSIVSLWFSLANISIIIVTFELFILSAWFQLIHEFKPYCVI